MTSFRYFEGGILSERRVQRDVCELVSPACQNGEGHLEFYVDARIAQGPKSKSIAR